MLSLFGCGKSFQKLDGDGMEREPFYAQISQDELNVQIEQLSVKEIN